MPLVTLARWKIDADPKATREAYRKRRQGRPEDCGCLHCRNFAAARDHIYTGDVLRALEPLGVDPPIREAEIYHTCPLASGLHLYGGFLHIVGKIAEGGDAKRQVAANSFTFETEKLTEHFSIGPTADCSLVHEAFRGLPLVQLEFDVAEVPWVLTEPFDIPLAYYGL